MKSLLEFHPKNTQFMRSFSKIPLKVSQSNKLHHLPGCTQLTHELLEDLSKLQMVNLFQEYPSFPVITCTVKFLQLRRNYKVKYKNT